MDDKQSIADKATVVSLADIKLDPERMKACEASYRRGVHQAIAFSGDIVDRSDSLKEARRLLTRAENHAGRLRFIRKDQGGGMLLDFIRQRLCRNKRRGPQ
jgi:hypothetical protein